MQIVKNPYSAHFCIKNTQQFAKKKRHCQVSEKYKYDCSSWVLLYNKFPRFSVRS